MNPRLAADDVQDYIQNGSAIDLNALSFQASVFEGVRNAELIEQIHSLTKAKKKLPDWTLHKGIVYPPKRAIEQSSSQYTAAYKASVCKKLLAGTRETAIDLTAGFGVDSSALSTLFNAFVSVECNPHLNALLNHNLKLLQRANVKVEASTAEEVLEHTSSVDFIYLDPDRRDRSGTRRVGFEHYAPNLIELYESLIVKARLVAIKVSPMIDLSYAKRHLPHLVRIDLVSLENELKELLLWIDPLKASEEVALVHAFLYKNQKEKLFTSLFENTQSVSRPLLALEEARYIIDLPSAFVKSRYTEKLLEDHPNLHMGFASIPSFLFSKELVTHLPARLFQIEEVLPYSKQNLKRFSGEAFSIQVKNQRQRPEEVRKRYNIKESPDHFLFLIDSKPGVIIRATKVNN